MRIFSLALLLAMPAVLYSFTPAEEAWLNDDSDIMAVYVNEGELTFLKPANSFDGHRHENDIVIHASSLDDGWVTLRQCHENLDKIDRIQIVYNPHRVKDIEIIEIRGIEEAWVKDASVQLRNVGEHAKVCIRSNSLALEPNDDGSYSLHNGPFMRRFLDGYYPMHVTVSVSLPEDYLSFDRITPQQQPGLVVKQCNDCVRFDAWFEGRLNTELRFNAL